MKLYSYLVCIFFIVLIFISTISNAGEAEKYFPLQVGNRWVYRHEHITYNKQWEPFIVVDTLTVSVTQTLEYDGNTYYLLESSVTGFNGYFRNDGDYAYLLTKSYGGEKYDKIYPFYDFASCEEGKGECRDGEYYYYRFGDPSQGGYTPRYNKSMALPIGYYNGYYFYVNVGDIHFLYYRFMVPNIGVVWMKDSIDMDFSPQAHREVYTLIYAYVNGIEFGSTTYVEIDIKPQILTILPNTPNPFNTFTTISFTLPSSGFTSLTVYNITGQKVRELLSENLSSGLHTITWDSRDDNGQPVSSGLYISQLKTVEHIATQRMLLVK